ncbi:YggT family protein [Labedella gwakjiensis]|uniref:YggT family protein n=2 Tax=Labedella gwakjiensis TaxID=390269 RepID=A0A2P8GZI3_9MICO|nr:YggT family protein [Labedella gwakjiensis]PSL39381.1 YggT family protein [Labedella gwakjiensis]
MGSIIPVIGNILYAALLIYLLAMWARFILDLVRTFNRAWRPSGVGLVAAEAVYYLTDPPIRFFRRVVPPVRVGRAALDFGWTLTMLCVLVAMILVGFIR